MADGFLPRASWLARAGAWARRPQTAMSAVFLMTAASSVLVLARKHHGSGASLSVHEQGAPLALPNSPEPATTSSAVIPSSFPSPTDPSIAAAARSRRDVAAAGPASIEDALAFQQNGNAEAALTIFRSLGDTGDARARFLQGKLEKDLSGCARAREIFTSLATDPQAGAIAFDARLEEGRCARKLDDDEGARRALQTLLDVPSHRERALAELRELD